MSKQQAIKFFHDEIAKEHMNYWKYKQKIENRMDLFTVEKDALVDEAYSQYKEKESEYIDILDSIQYGEMVNEIPIYNI